MLDLAQVKPASFDGLVGEEFTVVDSPISLVLRSVARINSPSPRGEPFSLVFAAPKSASGAQGTYRLRHADLGTLEVFLVPIAPEGGYPQFEAVFN